MGLFEIIAILLTLAALFSYVNVRVIKLPTTIGVMVISLAVSLALLVAGRLGLGLEGVARHVLSSVDLEATLLHGMLGFLLFAGSLHVNLNDLVEQRWSIGLLATGGVVVSTVLVAGLTLLAARATGVHLPLLACLLFGALISPTDPIAVLGIMRTARADKRLEVTVAGESLFNDGVGVTVFTVLLVLAAGAHELSTVTVLELLAGQAVGGVALGLLLGTAAYQMLKRVDDYQVEIMVTLAVVTGGYAVAEHLGTSGPLAMVVAGLLVGNHGRAFAMSASTRRHLDTFWELVDDVLNAVLFVLIGLEVLVLPVSPRLVLTGLATIPAVLLARWLSAGGIVALLRRRRPLPAGAIRVLTWGGLRGGISVALALSLPPGPDRAAVVSITYVVVIFSIVVQGLTVSRLVRATARS